MPHFKGHLRDAFADMVECIFDMAKNTDIKRNYLAYKDKKGRTADQLCGLLWNCADTAPANLCMTVDERRGSTYAQLARSLKGWAHA